MAESLGQRTRPSALCPVCRDCNGHGHSTPEDCRTCGGRGWVPFNTKCGAEDREQLDGCVAVHRCNLDKWHEGGHEEWWRVNSGTFFNPLYESRVHRWPCTSAVTESKEG